MKKGQKKIEWLIIVLLGIILGFFTLPFREKMYVFDWDQANDFRAVETIARGKMLLIGPRVTSDTGFFLAPWHYYYLLPFYWITRGNLEMGWWGAVLMQYLLVIVAFWSTKKWGGIVAGTMVGLFWATPSNLTAWGFMYVPVLSLIFFYGCLKTLEKPKLIIWLCLFFGWGCTTYAVFYALGIPLLYVIFKLIKEKKVSFLKLVEGGGLFFLPYLPLIVFDIRHDWLNLRNITRFASHQNGAGTQAGYFLTVFGRAVETSWIGRQLSEPWSGVVIGVSIAILIVGGIALFKKQKWLIGWWLVSSLIPMAMFRGNVSEYYYAPVTLLIPIFMAVLLVKRIKYGKIVLAILMIGVAGIRWRDKVALPVGVVLKDKEEVVEKLEKIGEKYSVSYALNLGEDNGYDLVLEKMGKNYVADGSAPLYTITYKEKKIPVTGQRVAETEKLAIYKR